MTAPTPGDREYRNQTVRLSELTILQPILQDLRFENCHILGPAVLAFLNNIEMNNISVDGTLDAVFWLIPPERVMVIGAVGVERCSFYSCRFEGVGFAGPAEVRDMFSAAFN